jgi:hypothetical protein
MSLTAASVNHLNPAQNLPRTSINLLGSTMTIEIPSSLISQLIEALKTPSVGLTIVALALIFGVVVVSLAHLKRTHRKKP